MTAIAIAPADTAQIKRLVEFAAEVARLADQRKDLDLHHLIDDLHADLRRMTMDNRDADRLELLDRIEKRVPEIDLDQRKVEWTTLEDGHEALLVDGGGLDGGKGAYIANAGEDLHAVGTLAPIIDGYIGCIVIQPDGSRYVAQAVPDPLAGGSRTNRAAGFD